MPAEFCGAGGCVTVSDPGQVGALHSTGAPTVTPDPAPFYIVRFRPGVDSPILWSYLYVPSARALRANDFGRGPRPLEGRRVLTPARRRVDEGAGAVPRLAHLDADDARAQRGLPGRLGRARCARRGRRTSPRPAAARPAAVCRRGRNIPEPAFWSLTSIARTSVGRLPARRQGGVAFVSQHRTGLGLRLDLLGRRRGWDSKPRNLSVRRLSRPPPSTTQPPPRKV